MLGTILLIVLILLLIGALPRWSYSRSWGYAPAACSPGGGRGDRARPAGPAARALTRDAFLRR
ncbi:MAG: DUF3309 family protein [Caulobacteraceae bacterium]